MRKKRLVLLLLAVVIGLILTAATNQQVRSHFNWVITKQLTVENTATLQSGLTVSNGSVTVSSGDVTMTAGDLTMTAGMLNIAPASSVVAASFVITPTATYHNLTSAAVVTSSTTTGIITTTATSGDVLILRNGNASDVINIDGTGGTIECKANVALGASDTLTLLFTGSVWNCLSNYDNS